MALPFGNIFEFLLALFCEFLSILLKFFVESLLIFLFAKFVFEFAFALSEFPYEHLLAGCATDWLHCIVSVYQPWSHPSASSDCSDSYDPVYVLVYVLVDGLGDQGDSACCALVYSCFVSANCRSGLPLRSAVSCSPLSAHPPSSLESCRQYQSTTVCRSVLSCYCHDR